MLPTHRPVLVHIALTLCLATSTSTASTVSISRLGAGNGLVSTKDLSVNCGSVCEHEFPDGVNPLLTATPDAHSTFLHWAAGPCEGKEEVCDPEIATTGQMQTIAVYFAGAAVAASGHHTIALRHTDGSVWAFGRNNAGQLGNRESTQSLVPVQVRDTSGPLTGMLAIAAGNNHSVALGADGFVRAWGKNDKGQLGDNTNTDRHMAVVIEEIQGITTLSAGYEHTLALVDSGNVYAWGNNSIGQLGDGTTEERNAPVLVKGLDDVIAIATGQAHSVALKNDGTVWAWGSNTSGQLGNGKTDTNPTVKPTQVSVVSGIVAIDSGALHTIALKNDGTIWVWGDNEHGQLGDSSRQSRLKPVKINKNGLGRVRKIATGDYHTVVLDEDGVVWLWGLNASGQFGDNSTTGRSTPVALTGITGAKAIAAGANHTVVVGNEGNIWAFGGNQEGELGDGTATSQHIPVQTHGLNLYGEQVVKYTVKATAGTGGTITPATRTVDAGKTTTFTVTPKAGYTISSVTGCNGSLPENSYTTNPASYTTGPIDAACAVKATFKAVAVPKYIVTATAGAGGTISPVTRTVEKGKTTTFTVKVKPVTKYTVTLKTAGTGSGTVTGNGSFAAGTTVQLTATAASGSTFTDWSPAPCAASFTMPAKALTCIATFTKDVLQSSYVPETVKITGGCFMMGSPEDELYHNDWGDETIHEVCVGDFEMGKYEVTFEEYDAFVNATGRRKPTDYWGRGRQPVVDVDWNDAVAYVEWLTAQTDQTYRLPTEAEWEYAARAGTTTPYWTGECVNTDQANYNGHGSYGNCPPTYVYRGRTLDVGSFPTNPWGIYDTIGNVYEWTCSDWSNPYNNDAEKKCSTGTSGTRSLRGGSFFSDPYLVRSTTRLGYNTTVRIDTLGFRLARSLK